MRKFTLFLALMVAMVTTAFAQTVVSNLSDFKSDKCYTVTTPSRGGWAVNSDASQFCSTNDAGLGTESDATDVNQQFAVLSVNGEDYFLYSVGAKKFIKHDRTLSAVSGDAIEFADASKEGAGRVRVNFKGIENSYINLGGSNQMSVDWWGTIDAGNAVQFLEVADFDATEALNLLNSKVELVYVYQYEGKEISRQTVDVMVGEAYPAINAPYGFTADAPQGVVEAAGEKIVECTFAGYPFEYAESVDAITTWYYIQMHSNNKKFIQYVDGANNIEWADAEVAEGEENSYIWAFVGTPATGFKLVNYAATVEKALCSDGSSDPAMGAFANGVNWVPAASDVVGDAFFCLQYPGSSNYMNAQNGKVAYWNDNDAGSTLQLTVAEPVVATPEPVTFDIYALDDSMNPSPLEGTVSKLGYVVFAASDNNAVLAEAADAPKVCIFDPAMGGAVAEASSIMFGDLLGNGMQLVAVQFDGFATPGAYMVYAPAGAFTVNGQPNEEIVSAQFTIPAPVVKVFEVESVTPANNAEVEAINKIEIKFTEDIYLSMDDRGNFYPVNLVDENNNVIELTTSDDANIYSKAVFTPAEPITAAGTYTLDLSQIKLDGGVCEGSYSWTVVAPAAEPGIDTSKEYYLYSSYNWGMNSGYLTIGTKSGSNYGQVYMDSNKKQSFKLTPSGDGYVVSRLADMGGMSYPEYLDCSHAYNVGNNAMSGSVLYFELNTNGKYYIRSANGYFKADKIDYTTTDWAYHVFSNGDMTSAMEWELVPAIDEEPTTPAVAPVIQTISPAAGAVVEGGVSEIVITFDKEIKSVSSGAQIKVKLGAATTRAYGSNATIDGCTVTFKFGDGGQFGFTTIEDAGEYSVEIPASLCTSEDGGASEAFSYKFTIAAPAELPALESTKYDRNPLETSYDFTTGLMGKFLLSGVKIYFGEVVKKYTTDLSGDYGQILDADGNVVATLDKCMGANGTMNDFATPYTTTPITAAGTYKVVVKSGVILSADGTKEYKGGEFTFTVEKAAVEVIPSAEDGFFWNASYSHVDEFNKQVITVKNADNDVVINNEVKATLTCGENVYEATVTVEKFDNIQEITLAFDGEFVEGKYTLDVPAGLFTVDGVANEAYAQSTFTYRKPQLEITRDFDSWESYLDQVWYMPKGAIITIANAQSVEVDDTKVATIAVGESVYNSTLSYYYDEWSNAYYIELMFEDFYAEGFEFVKGDYTFTLPAGLYTVNGVANEEAVKAYTYGDPIVEEFSVTEILPAAGSVLESLDAIAITFSNGAQPDILPVTCGDATYYFVSMYGMYVAVDLMSYEPIVITEPGTYTLDLSELEGLVGEKVFSWTIAEAVEEPVDYTPTYTGTVERNDRNVTAVTLGDNRYDLLTPEQSSCYVDATETVTFTVVAGATVKASVEHKGEWVHHSVYIDLDGDGFTSGLEEGSEWKPAGDLVTYSFYNNNGSSDEYGYNSVGTYMSGMDRHVPEMPEFTAPTTPGIYRIRFVQDWCSIDPNGDSDGKFGDFMANGGQIVDVMLEVVEGTTDGIEEVDAEAEKVIYDLTGRRILEITKSGIYVVNGKKVIVK